jgi:ribose transport system substrate-binding protein
MKSRDPRESVQFETQGLRLKGDLSERYHVDAVLRACDVLECFQTDSEALCLSEIAQRIGLTRSTTYRLLVTLESRGLVCRPKPLHYCRTFRLPRKRKYRIGYAAQSTEFAFSREVTESIVRVAGTEAVDLVVLDNRYSPRIALRNVDAFIREQLDLVMEFQTDGQVAPTVASRLSQRGIPLIAIEIPHPGATYYGAHNYEAGVIGGRCLGRWAKSQWQGRVDEVLLMDLAAAGPVPRARLTGIIDGVRAVVGMIPDSCISVLNGNGQFARSLELARKQLRKSKSRRTLISGINDPSVIGALRGFQELGMDSCCAAVGQNASLEARAELRRPGSRLIGSVAFFPEKYGEGLIPLALDILEKKPVPPAVYVKHKLITMQNVDNYYPNDPAVDLTFLN